MKKFDGFMHGVNLGGWFSQCDYSEDRLNNFIKEEDLKTDTSRCVSSENEIEQIILSEYFYNE